MSQEIRLPAELAACEALLAAHALPACGIDRDSLLYRAGWEAALAHIGATGQCAGGETDRLAGTLESPLAKGRDRGGISRSTRAAMAWSAASAALAASIAVAATLALRPPGRPFASRCRVLALKPACCGSVSRRWSMCLTITAVRPRRRPVRAAARRLRRSAN
ncbi:MAG: hypothetical protein DCC67_18565 [Planctomycetota bacterium]|nr:MAG: hypothetical protein DCC67_18565 [Planctomycetota bacterium]